MNGPTTPKRCDHCAFYAKGPGDCRRHSPRMDFDKTGDAAVWPVVDPDHWCGEFQPPGLRGDRPDPEQAWIAT